MFKAIKKLSLRSLVVWVVGIGLVGTLLVILAAARGERRVSIDPTYKDVNYCTIDGVTSQMDIYAPTTSKTNLPLAVYVHGGGWSGGDKKAGEGAADIPELVTRGYVVASLNYRLAPKYPFPAQIQDVKCGIRYLKSQASRYKIDPGKVVAFGGSAGGHLVSLLGTSDKTAGFDVGLYLDQSSRVQAVVDYFGPSLISDPVFYRDNKKIVDRVFLSTAAQTAGSPLTYVSKDDPPFLIVHGDEDGTVPLALSQMLKDALSKVGVQAILVVDQNVGHGFKSKAKYGTPSLTRGQITASMADFFDSIVK